MITDSIGAHAAHAFDPAEWLVRFNEIGGWWILTDDQVTLGWAIYGFTDEQNMLAREMFKDLRADAEHVAAVKRHLQSSAKETAGE